MSAISNSPEPKEQFIRGRQSTSATSVENTFGSKRLPGSSGSITPPKVAANKNSGSSEASVPSPTRTFISMANSTPEFDARKDV